MTEIKTTKHLKPESYYNDLYDRFTVDSCRRLEKICKAIDLPSADGKKFTEKDGIKAKIMVENIALYFEKGERWKRKAETIREWIERDETKDEKLENAVIPTDIFCKKCNSEMIAESKNLYDDELKKEERVLFLFDCSNNCKPSRAIFEGGEEWHPVYNCDKCNSRVEVKHSRKDNLAITTYTCKNCGYKGRDTLDLSPSKKEKEKIDKNFEKDRKRFCLSATEGQEYIDAEANLKHLSEMMKEIKEKDKISKAVAKIKKLPIAGLKKLLITKLEKQEYIKLEFSKPEMSRDVIVEFTVQDNKEEREEYDSRSQLKKLLKQILENTNWRLMSEGIYYRLGILTGRLRGCENDEDLLKLIKL